MKIYICSSSKNLESVRALRDELTGHGHFVLDWTTTLPDCGKERERVKDADPAGSTFTFCSTACAQVDLLVYLGPAGQDAGCELGMAYTSGIPVWAVPGKGECLGLMAKGCVSRWFMDAADVSEALCNWRGW